jgi:hypothetical protein
MPERLIDVERKGAEVLHTFPVTASAPATDEEAFKQKALEAAANAKLVPNDQLENLNAKMHVSRGGQLTPYGDPHGVLAETKAGLDQVVRERAYLIWGHRQVNGGDGGTKRIMASACVMRREARRRSRPSLKRPVHAWRGVHRPRAYCEESGRDWQPDREWTETSGPVAAI